MALPLFYNILCFKKQKSSFQKKKKLLMLRRSQTEVSFLTLSVIYFREHNTTRLFWYSFYIFQSYLVDVFNGGSELCHWGYEWMWESHTCVMHCWVICVSTAVGRGVKWGRNLAVIWIQIVFILPSKKPLVALLTTQTLVKCRYVWSSARACYPKSHQFSMTHSASALVSSGWFCLRNTAFGESSLWHPFSCAVGRLHLGYCI